MTLGESACQAQQCGNTAARLAEFTQLAALLTMYQTNQDRIFKMVADEYLAANEGQWTAKNAKHNRQLLEDHLYPAIGHRILLSLSEVDYQSVLDRLCDSGMYETARRLRTRILHVLSFAVEKGYASPSDLPFSPQRPARGRRQGAKGGRPDTL